MSLALLAAYAMVICYTGLLMFAWMAIVVGCGRCLLRLANN